MKKNIVILGGGVGGVVVARQLASKLSAKHRITLIDKSPKHYFQPAFLGVMTGRLEPESTHKDLKNIENTNLHFVNEEVAEIDAENQKVITRNKVFEYDYLIVALGAKLAPEKVPELKDAGFTPYHLESALQLRDQIKNFSGKKIAILISSMPYKCPAAPHETAFLIDANLRKSGKRKHVSISIYTPEGQPMPAAGPEAGVAIKSLLEQREIAFNPGLNISSVDSLNNELIFNDDKKERFDLLIYIPPHAVPDVVASSALTGETGWIPVDMHSLQTKHSNVYAIGDVTTIKLPGAYKPDMPLMLPKAGVFAHEQAKIVADNIAADIEGKRTVWSFNGQGACFLETGIKKAGFAKGNFYATPKPSVDMRPPSLLRYFNKMLFEKYWLWTKP